MVPLADNEKVRCRVAELLLVMLSPLTLIDVTEADSTESEDVEEIDELSEGVDVLVSVWLATPVDCPCEERNEKTTVIQITSEIRLFISESPPQ